MKALKVAIRILCLVLVVGVVLTAVFFRGNNVREITFKDEIFKAESKIDAHSDFSKIASSGFIELYFNQKTSAIAVKELSQEHTWLAMPDSNSSMVTMSVADEKGTHYLNSQSNSKWVHQLKEDGVYITYTISKDDISIEAFVDITLKDGSLFVTSNVKNLSENEDCAVLSYSVLPDFCSFFMPETNDFLLLPDGCGAVIYPALSDEKITFDAKIYGDDYAVKATDCADSIVGAFGIKKGESAVAVIIDSGEEIATVKATGDKNNLSSIAACFDINDYAKKGNKLLFNENAYSGDIKLCYKFLSGDNASYSEIASSCREQFIRNGSLPSTNVEAHDNVPLYLTLTGAYKSSAWSPVNVEYTTFSQALDILSRVKSKGVDNITVRYNGVLKQNSTSFVSSLGSKSDLKELYSYADSQNISLFMDANIFTYRSVFGKFDFSAIKQMNKSTAAVISDESPDESSQNNAKYRFRKTTAVDDYVADLIKKAQDVYPMGYCIGDAEFLSSDYNSKNVTRGDIKTVLASQIPALSNIGQVMVDKGNMYMIKNSSSVINIPMITDYEESEYYVAIPFVQAVLHGRITMAGTPININEDMKKATLQCLEYGVCPSFTTVYSGKNLHNNVLFENIVNEMIDCYNIASDALIGLEGERITEHTKLKEGVYLTTYGDTARIYVNYNDTAVTVNGVTVDAMNYLRID